jgi:SAM-dependent methyltransferase
MKRSEVEYIGKDLESMDLAVNYHRWIIELIRPYLGDRIVEVGAGRGALTKLLLECRPRSLVAIEPSDMFFDLEKHVIHPENGPTVRFYHDTFTSVTADIIRDGRPDTVIYINVLEHIEDDEEELRLVYETLSGGGTLCIFVPAMPILLSKFDRHIGHFRRYGRRELTRKCTNAGFEIETIRGFDVPGILPWLIKYRLLGSIKMESSAVGFYDRFLIPLIRPIENLLRPPIGKNLLIVARKPKALGDPADRDHPIGQLR